MKYLVLYSVFFFFAFRSVAQKPLVQLTVEPKTANVGDVITISVKSNIHGDIEVDLPQSFTQGYDIMNGMEQETDYNTGRTVTYYFYSHTGTMEKEGTFTFGPAYVKKGNKVYRSNTVSVTIKKEAPEVQSDVQLTPRQLREPAFGIITQSAKSIYEGEPLVLSAKIYTRFNATHLENYRPFAMDGVIDKHDIGNSSRILLEEARIRGNNYFTFDYDKKVVFPTGSGKQKIDPFKLILHSAFDAVSITSSGASVEVKPLPAGAPSSFTGGVGTFTITREVSDTRLRQGDVFTMKVTISGTGNLQNIGEPELDLPDGFSPYGDPVMTEDLTYSFKGAEGSITFEFNIQVNRSGDLTFPKTAFAYFDPKKEKYIETATEPMLLKIQANPNFSALPNAENPMSSTLDTWSPMREEFKGHSSNALDFGSPLYWGLLGSPLFLGLIFGLWMRRKQENEQVPAVYEHPSRDEIIAEFEILARSHPERNNAFYAAIQYTLETHICACLRLHAIENPSNEYIVHQLIKHGATDTQISRYTSLLSSCENAQYGMGFAAIDAEQVLMDARIFILELHNA
ncbi:MAG: hypothetical protein RL632_2110 [Bacteroidota bacterium]